MFPMTYTARATLEIGSGAVCSGRAVTSTTPSHQVRTTSTSTPTSTSTSLTGSDTPRGPARHHVPHVEYQRSRELSTKTIKGSTGKQTRNENRTDDSQLWAENVDNWYKSLSNYTHPLQYTNLINSRERNVHAKVTDIPTDPRNSAMLNIDNHFISPLTLTSGNSNSPGICPVPVNDINYTHVRHRDEGAHRVIDDSKCDIKLRKSYRRQVGEDLVVPTLTDINPRNVRRMTIGQPIPQQQVSHSIDTHHGKKRLQKTIKKDANIVRSNKIDGTSNSILNDVKSKLNNNNADISTTKTRKLFDSSTKCYNSSDEGGDIACLKNPFVDFENEKSQGGDVELLNVNPSHSQKRNTDNNSFTEYLSKQQRLLKSLENSKEGNFISTSRECEKEEICQAINIPEYVTSQSDNDTQYTKEQCSQSACVDKSDTSCSTKSEDEHSTLREDQCTTKSDRIVLTQLPNNAYIFLTLPKPLVSPSNSNVNTPIQLFEIENKPLVSDSYNKPNIKKKRQKMSPEHPGSSDVKKSALDKNVLKVLLFENVFKNNASENLSHNSGVSSITNDEVGCPL